MQKIMARAGLGSRRKLEQEIASGQVRVNGPIAELGTQVKAGDRIEFEGSFYDVIAERKVHQTLIYYKPEGQVTTRDDPEGRRTVFEQLPHVEGGRWIAIGRLDINTSGLLLMTTDGELAHRMMHPSGRVDREYLCRVRGAISDGQIEKLLKGVELEDGAARFSDLIIGEQTPGHTWVTVTIMEGRNREVRRLWEAVGVQVARLKRVRFGPVFMPSTLKPGHCSMLSPVDHKVLRQDVGLKPGAVELSLKLR
ncbi:MAG: pseudouridine synthase [Wenzhouxiangellaceae bacterium]|nr:pseudouridine synthase [Wenzhouxiangellaceae bacterium]